MEYPDLSQPYYREFSPCPLLADYIRCYWVITANNRVRSPVMNRVLPDGCIDIIFNLGDPFYRTIRNSFVGDVSRSYVVGAMRQPMVVGLTGHVEVIGVRFKPGGAYPFFCLSLHELADSTVALDDLWNQSSPAIELRLAEESTIARKIAHLEDVLMKHLETISHVDGIVRQAVQQIDEAKGQIPIAVLGKSLNISSRHLERKFLENVGLSPKMFCRVIRIHHAISILHRQSKPEWGEIVYESGFYDQAHFIREFKTIAGLTPGAYVSEQVTP